MGTQRYKNDNSERAVRPASVILSSTPAGSATRHTFSKESGGERGVYGARTSRCGEGWAFPRATRLTHLSSTPPIPSRRMHWPLAGVVAAQNDKDGRRHG